MRSLAERDEPVDEVYEEYSRFDSPMFDDYVQLEKELATWVLPKSRWTKATVMEYCRIKDILDKAMAALERMKLEDIRNCFLLDAGTMITGSWTEADRRRHTRFYVLDTKGIRNLGRIAVRGWKNLIPGSGIVWT